MQHCVQAGVQGPTANNVQGTEMWRARNGDRPPYRSANSEGTTRSLAGLTAITQRLSIE